MRCRYAPSYSLPGSGSFDGKNGKHEDQAEIDIEGSRNEGSVEKEAGGRLHHLAADEGRDADIPGDGGQQAEPAERHDGKYVDHEQRRLNVKHRPQRSRQILHGAREAQNARRL